jgi:phosphoribosylglycinamide formyltransferase-1
LEISNNQTSITEKLKKINLAIFASGTGTNAKKIIHHFKNSLRIEIKIIVCNNPAAEVLIIADNEKIPALMVEKKKFKETGYVNELKSLDIDFIVLAGFLWKIPPVLIHVYPDKIINIHPALLPAFGGKGMYGNAVHAAVIAAKEKQSGITIHFVDEKYDHGKIIFQKSCTIIENESVESLAKKIHELEHTYYPKQIEKIVTAV